MEKTVVKKETGHFESFDGTRIYYESHGEGPVIVLTYGIGCLLNHWRYQVEYFSKTHRVISYDLRGHHKSEAPVNRDEITIKNMGKDLIALVDHLGVTEFSAWGHSFGVPVVLSALEERPELINSLVFVNGFYYNPFEGKLDTTKANQMHQRMQLYQKFIPGVVDFVWKKATSSPLTIPAVSLAGGFNSSLTPREDIERYVEGLQNLDTDVYFRCFNDMVNWDGRDLVTKIDKPTLIVAGVKDKISPMKRQNEFHSMVPKSQFVKFPQGTHCTQLDMRDAVNAEVENFLNNRGSYSQTG